ncbi:hypothetical protein JCM1840_004028 [Sporobolomyces johnsonii]
MKESTQLAISLGTVFGTLSLVLSLAFARFVYRKHQKARSEPVDPVYEAKVNLGQDDDGETTTPTGSTKKRWFGGSWGITPVAEVGPNGTKQYLGGWFGLDAPSYAGWTQDDADDDTLLQRNHPTDDPDPISASGGWRESHFSRASRASKRRSQRSSTSTTKKRPRPSRTTEMGMLEKDDDDAQELRRAPASSREGEVPEQTTQTMIRQDDESLEEE